MKNLPRLSLPKPGPLLHKELTTRMRSRSAPLSITLFLALTGGVAFMIYLIGASSGARRAGNSGESGTVMFYFLVAMQLIAASFITPAFAAVAISGERQRGTLALLHASAMTATQIVLGKFIVAVGYALLFVFASLPLFSLVLLLGSIEVYELVMALSVVIASIVLFVALGLYASATARTRAISTVVTYAFTLGVVIGIPVLLLVMTAGVQSTLGSVVRSGGVPLLRDAIEALFGLALSLSPFTAIIGSRTYFENAGDALFFRQPVFNATTGVTLLSPYITLTVVYLVLTIILLMLAVRRVRAM